MICLESTLDPQIKFIPTTLCNNGFPLNVVQIIINNKITDFNKIKQTSAQRCSVYLRLSWLGGITVQMCYFSANVRMVVNTKSVKIFFLLS